MNAEFIALQYKNGVIMYYNVRSWRRFLKIDHDFDDTHIVARWLIKIKP